MWSEGIHHCVFWLFVVNLELKYLFLFFVLSLQHLHSAGIIHRVGLITTQSCIKLFPSFSKQD